MKVKIEIKNRWTGKVLFEFETENNSTRKTLLKALEEGANLEGANLRSANLEGADLRSANLEGADLRSANLEGANLEGANLEGANLRSANLRSANLRSANLRSANLEGADLRSADLEPIKKDFFDVLLRTKNEFGGLKEALINGKVDGSTYEGECACLVGTIANVKKCHYEKIPKLFPDSRRPIERFFCGISAGDKPETNQFSKIAIGWIEEFEELIK